MVKTECARQTRVLQSAATLCRSTVVGLSCMAVDAFSARHWFSQTAVWIVGGFLVLAVCEAWTCRTLDYCKPVCVSWHDVHALNWSRGYSCTPRGTLSHWVWMWPRMCKTSWYTKPSNRSWLAIWPCLIASDAYGEAGSTAIVSVFCSNSFLDSRRKLISNQWGCKGWKVEHTQSENVWKSMLGLLLCWLTEMSEIKYARSASCDWIRHVHAQSFHNQESDTVLSLPLQEGDSASPRLSHQPLRV